jgi:hypothetical protein
VKQRWFITLKEMERPKETLVLLAKFNQGMTQTMRSIFNLEERMLAPI